MNHSPKKHPDESPLRVEQALRLVPQLETLEPLRALMVSTSQTPESTRWSAAAPYVTVGKRAVWPMDVRQRRRQVLSQFTQHISSLYESVLEVLEHEQRGDIAAAVRSLLNAGETEERAGRFIQARAWYDVALAVSKDFQDRRLEFESVFGLGHIAAILGEYSEAARYYQRALALAENQGDTECIILACQGLGRLGRGRGPWGKAELWFNRGLALAEQHSDRLHAAQFYRDLGVVARRDGNLAIAEDWFNQAKATFQDLEAAADMAFTMNDEGQLDVASGRLDDAIASYQEALGWLRRGRRNLWLEVSIKINLANALMEMGRFPEATDQLREGEEMTIVHNFTQGLAQIYVALGKLCRHHVDENGFVFFEKALELSHAPDCSTILEGEIYLEYGVFRSRLGHRQDAIAHLNRARLIFDSVGDQTQLTVVLAEIERLQP